MSQLARKRKEHEESIVNECQANIRRIRERESSLKSTIAEVDERSERAESNSSRKGLEMLSQMNGDLEILIRKVY